MGELDDLRAEIATLAEQVEAQRARMDAMAEELSYYRVILNGVGRQLLVATTGKPPSRLAALPGTQ